MTDGGEELICEGTRLGYIRDTIGDESSFINSDM
jgi:hypothetical protein